MRELLDIKDISIRVRKDNEDLTLVENLSLKVRREEIVGLVGESGCGKSMTALSIIQLLPKNLKLSGNIYLDGKNLSNLKKNDIKKVRGKDVSMIFQEPMRALNPLQKVGQQVDEVLKIHTKLSKKDRKKRVLELFKKIGIKDPKDKYYLYPHQLSGGINQRIMIAIAAILEPKLIIADEPTTALDVTIQGQILKLMKNIKEENNGSILLITHDLAVVAEICDRVYVMYAGQIVESSKVEDLFSNPKHPYTKALLESVPRVEKNISELNSIEGSVPNLTEDILGCKFYSRCKERKDICKRQKIELYRLEDIYCRCIKYKENNHG